MIVTGGASGMGRATAHLFGDEGASVAVTDVTLEGASAVAEEILGAGGTARAWALDVRDDTQVRAVVSDVVEQLGPVDILVNNAGVSIPAPIDVDSFDAAWDTTFEVNLHGHTRMVRACLPYLVRNGEGRIVNIASTEGVGATGSISAYTASKHGVIGLTRSLAVELGARGVTVNCICPGPDPHRDDVVDPRRCEAEVRSPSRAVATVRRARGGRPRDVVARPAGQLVHQRRGADRRRWDDGEEHLAVRPLLGFATTGNVPGRSTSLAGCR